jgi:uncharacterized cupin superfamily protein
MHPGGRYRPGINLSVLNPGESMGMYHWEADQEDFLVLAGEALARPLIRPSTPRPRSN